jgi:hypothetical protein
MLGEGRREARRGRVFFPRLDCCFDFARLEALVSDDSVSDDSESDGSVSDPESEGELHRLVSGGVLGRSGCLGNIVRSGSTGNIVRSGGIGNIVRSAKLAVDRSSNEPEMAAGEIVCRSCCLSCLSRNS